MRFPSLFSCLPLACVTESPSRSWLDGGFEVVRFSDGGAFFGGLFAAPLLMATLSEGWSKIYSRARCKKRSSRLVVRLESAVPISVMRFLWNNPL